MRQRNRKPISVSMLFMNSRVDLAWGGRFTMKLMECMKGDEWFFSGATESLPPGRQELLHQRLPAAIAAKAPLVLQLVEHGLGVRRPGEEQ
jgi:hypothetical protein